jgi:hypothetical protein
MKAIITFLALLLAISILALVPTLAEPYASLYGSVTIYDCARALIFCFVLSAIAAFLIRRIQNHGSYLLKLFMLALLLRITIGTIIFVFKGQDFFGGDAWTYDYFGAQQLAAWGGNESAQFIVDTFLGRGFGSGWGMVYLVGGVYGILGRNMLAIQFFNSVLGAATAPIIFMCGLHVFNNRRVAKVAAIAVAFYPSLVLWSAQGLKDGPIVFFLALCILATLKLGQRFNGIYLATLVVSLFCVLALRFYVFYMLLAAIVGAFLIGMRAVSAQSIARQFAVVMIVGLSLTYFGITRYASAQFETYATFEQLNSTRADASQSAQSGFGRDVDVSTTTGALSAIPVGMLYLLFAPFPWQLSSLRQSLTLPEMIIWWACFPMLMLGLWFSIKYRLRQLSPILIFTSMLSLAYSVFQGNVGTAYRQRAQLLVFYFLFVAVGFVMLKEKREEKARREQEERRLAAQRGPRWKPAKTPPKDQMPVEG